MTLPEILRLYTTSGIPLADIKTVFDGYFHVPFDGIGIHEKTEIPDRKVRETLMLLKDGYPAVYLTGYDDILGIHLFLNESVLIPRTETIDFLSGYLFPKENMEGKRVLDLCTGSGVIALTLKKRFPTALVTASDVSEKALALAKKSAIFNDLNVLFVLSDFLKRIEGKYDVIVSNPPYIALGDKAVSAPYEPSIALYSGSDGCDSYRSIFDSLDTRLSEKGVAYFECVATHSLLIRKIFFTAHPKGFRLSFIKDMEGKNRYLKIGRVTSNISPA